jgi:hypothetical protein
MGETDRQEATFDELMKLVREELHSPLVAQNTTQHRRSSMAWLRDMVGQLIAKHR